MDRSRGGGAGPWHEKDPGETNSIVEANSLGGDELVKKAEKPTGLASLTMTQEWSGPGFPGKGAGPN